MPLNKYPDRPEDEVCGGCRLLPTKSEAMPPDIATHAADALTLSELTRSGASLSYPHSLSAAEWAGLRGLTRGSERAESDRRKREEKKNKKDRQRSRS